jgi:hypothetical protein
MVQARTPIAPWIPPMGLGKVTPVPARGSEPPEALRWQVPQATVSSLAICSSQKRILPRMALSQLYGFSLG